MSKRFCFKTSPKALAENEVICQNARFTVLTGRLIRLEFSSSGDFEDRASQSVFFRSFPKVDFEYSLENGILRLETADLRLCYKAGAEFSADTLSVSLKNEPAAAWHYGESVENLGGTYKTLDGVNGAVDLEDGVCSRYGYALLDDSSTMLLNDEGWVEVRKSGSLDIYFFGYGYSYLDAVKDYYLLTGIPPMLPDYALGNWWSRYYAYTQQEYLDLMDRFKAENIPFSVSVVDMDWHLVGKDIPVEEREPVVNSWKHWSGYGWTGYTWNEKLFPDYKQFLKELKKRNLKTSLNLHPHAGVCPHEKQYEEMAAAVGMKADGKNRVPFDILSPKFMEAYFDILHHPYEEDGVDFWWMDWQQGNTYWWIHEENRDGKMADKREILDPLWMLNHLHIADIMRNGKRPMFFSRFSGAGSQRYPVGFSGDTVVSWDSLDFQPYFTATASNVGYSWWSHDIGGHFCGYRDADLELRWVQLGVFSPINRLHSTCNEIVRKEPWTFSKETEKIMGDWLRLRHRLFPYLYTMNYRNHTELVPLVQPMYYYYPKCDAAYNMKNQYFFGSELMVAPITSPCSEVTGLGSVKAFLPKGDWFDFFSGLHYRADKNTVMKLCRDRESYPVFAKAGAIVPMMELACGDNSLTRAKNMEIVIFPAASNTFNLYEDSGDYSDFEKGEFVTTRLELECSENSAKFTVNRPEGKLSLIPEKRSWKLCFRGFDESCSVSLALNGKKTDVKAVYNKEALTLEVTVEALPTEEITAEITGKTLITDNGDRKAKCYEILRCSKLSHSRLSYLQEAIAKADVVDEMDKILRADSAEEQGLTDALLEQLSLYKFN